MLLYFPIVIQYNCQPAKVKQKILSLSPLISLFVIPKLSKSYLFFLIWDCGRIWNCCLYIKFDSQIQTKPHRRELAENSKIGNATPNWTILCFRIYHFFNSSCKFKESCSCWLRFSVSNWSAKKKEQKPTKAQQPRLVRLDIFE